MGTGISGRDFSSAFYSPGPRRDPGEYDLEQHRDVLPSGASLRGYWPVTPASQEEQPPPGLGGDWGLWVEGPCEAESIAPAGWWSEQGLVLERVRGCGSRWRTRAQAEWMPAPLPLAAVRPQFFYPKNGTAQTQHPQWTGWFPTGAPSPAVISAQVFSTPTRTGPRLVISQITGGEGGVSVVLTWRGWSLSTSGPADGVLDRFGIRSVSGRRFRYLGTWSGGLLEGRV